MNPTQTLLDRLSALNAPYDVKGATLSVRVSPDVYDTVTSWCEEYRASRPFAPPIVRNQGLLFVALPQEPEPQEKPRRRGGQQKPLRVGSAVRFALAHLRATMQYSGPDAPTSYGPHARGTVLEVRRHGGLRGPAVCRVQWADGRVTSVLETNLEGQ